MSDIKHNFYAGPAVIAKEVLHKASIAAKEYQNIGLSLLEISHRSAEVKAIMEEAVSLVKTLLSLDDRWEVLFLTGGASSQFFMSAMTLLRPGSVASFVDTGSWSTKAIKEARKFGDIELAATSKDSNYSYIPKDLKIHSRSRYLHLTSNNTIFGTQYQDFPDINIPLVCDMSSDIFSRPIDVSKFGMIYAGAQKNLGPAGVTMVIINKDFLGDKRDDIPTMLNYHTHIEKESAFNTPPVFQIYVCLESLRWLQANGGITAMEVRNREKAALLYEEIDRNPNFKGTCNDEDRSLMNVTFVPINDQVENQLLKASAEAGCVGIKGHRSVGGFRASIYNALEKSSVQTLVDVMKSI